MLNTFVNAWKIKDIRTKLFYMLFVLFIVRLGSHIYLPGIDIALVAEATKNNDTLLSLITGSSAGSIFAMGIGPYITASIIMQLLTVAIPYLEQINKEGEEGRKKINQITRIVAVVLAFLQGIGQVYSLHQTFSNPNYWSYFVAVLSMVTGTIFIMWLAEQLTKKGIGNGASFIIFANILTGLPAGAKNLQMAASAGGAMGWVKVVGILLIFVFLIAFVVLVQDGERRIPIQYSKKMVGRKMYGGQSSYVPIKVNIAGVMSIIFSISLLQFPQVIYQLWQPAWLDKAVQALSLNSWTGAILYVILIFLFTFFYTSFAFNPVEVAENLKKNGGFIPGVRPGKPTSDFITSVVDRMSMIGACFYAAIAIIPIVLGAVFKINVGFGGTTLLIVSGVALEIIKQLESQLIMRHYKGFLS